MIFNLAEEADAVPYSTRQRQAVLDCLSRRREEPVTAREVAELLRREGCAVGLATVYRQLEKLEEAGLAHKANTEDGALYRYCGREAGRDCFLLKCRGCGRLLHLDCSHLGPLYEHLEQRHHFVIDPRATVFTGLCDVCARGAEETEGRDHGA